MGKVACIGGGGVRTPLVVFGINECAREFGVDEIVLYDPDLERAQTMVALGQAVVAREGGTTRVRAAAALEDAIEGADFVLSSIRVLAALPHAPGMSTPRFPRLPRARNHRPGRRGHGVAHSTRRRGAGARGSTSRAKSLVN